MPGENVSALDALMTECDIMRSAARMSRGPHIDTLTAARAELAALRERVRDLEALMRATHGPLHRGFRPKQVYTMTAINDDGTRWLDVAFYSGVGDFRVQIDDTGIPVLPLTPAARRALGG